MTAAEWVSDVFDEGERSAISLLLADGIAWSTRSQREQFLTSVGEAIGNYRRLTLPMVERRAFAINRLDLLAKTGRAFRKAVEKLTAEADELLEENFFTVGRRYGTDVDHAASEATAMLKRIRTASETAFFAATIAVRSTKSARLSERQGGDSLITDLAHSYLSAFGERPGFSRNSCFAKVLPSLLQVAGYRTSVGEDRCKRLIARIGNETHAKRGRRPNQN
ncbi:TIGR03761 family integrating conjugative element protein [Mesorhizobium sp. M0862]|uniref:hypothetical protein n=1 Tax=Mesorhizobium sp. M0862 TaxID=2957015 RepID=UPI0033370E43